MTESKVDSARGPLLLTLAQAWHALSGYLIFIVVARVLGPERYGGFAAVLWAMTTIEAFATEGIPKAVAFHVARTPRGARALLRQGLRQTALVSVGLFAMLFVAAPFLASLWNEPHLATAVRISGLDFITFVGFAVVVQVLNGRHLFARQALIWVCYSTLKLVIVIAALLWTRSIEGAMMGYVAASFAGSIAAVVLGRWDAIGDSVDAVWPARDLWRFGLFISVQAIALLALVNIDLWVVKSQDGLDPAHIGAYGAAATLARALFFIFRAFGEGLFPAVAAHAKELNFNAAHRSASRAIGLLCCLLLPVTGLAMGAGSEVLTVLFDDASYALGADAFFFLAPAAAVWTLLAVLVSLLSALERPAIATYLLFGMVVVTVLACTLWAGRAGMVGAAMGALASALLGLGVVTLLVTSRLKNVFRMRSLLPALLGAAILQQALSYWHPAGWLIFPYGSGLLSIVLLGLHFGRALPPKS